MIQSHSARAAATTSEGLASWYTPGLVDGFGDRLLMFDNTDTDSLELLRFYPSLTAIAGFEDALHERVRQVGRLANHAFPLIVAVERLDGDGALALVSTHIPGKRLSTFFDRPGPRKGLNPAFVTGVVTQLTQALALLQAKGDAIAHSAVTSERVIVTSGGRVCLVEHVLGAALMRLNLSAAQLWREFGLVVAPDRGPAAVLDSRTDVFQLGALALELLIGRRLTSLDLKDRLPDLLDQWSTAATRAGVSVDRLRHWLERALQFGGRGYAAAADALADLRDAPAESPASVIDSLPHAESDTGMRRPLHPARQLSGLDAHMANTAPPDLATPAPRVHMGPRVEPAASPPSLLTDSRSSELPASEKAAPAAGPRPLGSATPDPPATSRTPPAALPAKHESAPRRVASFTVPRVSVWVAAALGAMVVLEGAVIVALLMARPAAPRAEAAQPLPVSVPVITANSPPVDVSAAPAADARGDAGRDIERAASNQRSGGVRLVSPIELKVLDGDRVLGSTADGPIVASAGTHQLELVNAAFGLRMRQPVTFRAGSITPLTIQIPPARVSINAQPWAEVLIDNRSYGETPLANLIVPIGEHEIVFRHPDHGERRQTFTVRADQPNRISMSFDR